MFFAGLMLLFFVVVFYCCFDIVVGGGGCDRGDKHWMKLDAIDLIS